MDYILISVASGIAGAVLPSMIKKLIANNPITRFFEEYRHVKSNKYFKEIRINES